MNEREKALRLLERLRTRTEARGATAAEAAQAAELAERIVRRYGLDGSTAEQTPHQKECELGGRMPHWAVVLSMALEIRLSCTALFRRGGGQPIAVVFRGEEHRVRVAQWLFLAIAKDLRKLADADADKFNLRGGDRVRFRTRFQAAAAWEVHWRMNPRPTLPTAEITVCVERSDKRLNRRKSCRQVKELSPVEYLAMTSGIDAGRNIEIGTNAVGTVAVGRLA